jgi:transcriptional regulator CtsR
VLRLKPVNSIKLDVMQSTDHMIIDDLTTNETIHSHEANIRHSVWSKNQRHTEVETKKRRQSENLY